MLEILPFFILLPLFGFLASLLVSRKRERVLSGIALAVVGLHLLGTVAFVGGIICAYLMKAVQGV